MDQSIKYFSPSMIRGVYRFDDRLSKIKTDVEAKDFIETKLRFLPEKYKGIFSKFLDLETIGYENTIAPKLMVIEKNPRLNTEAKKKYEKYFATYEYFGNQKNNEGEGADNYLEAEFVRKILSPILTEEGLLKVEPQTKIERYFADFTILGEKNYLFEIDGFNKFLQRKNLDGFTNRQNTISKQDCDWKILRYTYTAIVENTARTRREVYDIFKRDNQLKKYLAIDRQNNGQVDIFDNEIQQQTEAEQILDVIDTVNDFYRTQDYYISQFLNEQFSHLKSISIIDTLDYPFPLVALSLSDLFYFLSDIERLFGLTFNLPNLVIHYTTFDQIYQRYLHPKISIKENSNPEEEKVEFRIASDDIVNAGAFFYPPPGDSRSINLIRNLEVETIKEYLNYTINSIFGYSATKPFQEQVLKHIFDGKNVLGIFPTGSGKSFCFWLPALLNPGLSIVICPLRSLMRDQRLTLENYGIASADFINSDVEKSERNRILHDVKSGRVKLLYVAPERIRIKDFIDELRDIQKVVKINYLIIDEAHCISEWGHDFRPSYMNIPFFYQQLKEENEDLQLIALTATAGQMVRRDIKNLLNLNNDDIITGKDLDRIHFSYQIITVDGPEEKATQFKQVLTESIPTSLSYYLSNDLQEETDIHKVLNSRNSHNEKAIGIVYVVFADPHGKHSTTDGLAHYLYDTKKIIEPEAITKNSRIHYTLEAYGTGKVRGFSSKKPTLCPKCNSYSYVSQRTNADDEEEVEIGEDIDFEEVQAGRKVCLNLDCGHEFYAQEVAFPKNYSTITRQNQNDFKRGTFDILVATKGFGMGIDKGSVRFVLHTSASSSIESWYQEVGRAGRDEERAHCVALVDVPNEPCLRELQGFPIKEPRCSWQTGCPHGKKGLCDYGKQHMFIKQSYTGVENDVVAAVRTLDKLITSFINGHSGHRIQFISTHARLKYNELALFRLKVLGIVEDFSVTYSRPIVSRPIVSRPIVFFDVTLNTENTQDGKLTIRTNADEIKTRLTEYLEKNRQDDEPPISAIFVEQSIYECKEKYDINVIKKLGRQNLENYENFKFFYHKIIDYLLVLLDHTYNKIVKMRYDMLWNLYDVIRSKECRRPQVLAYLLSPQTFEEGYRCNLCDNCIKELDFIADSRVHPQGTKQEHELQRELEEAFESKYFDYEKLLRLRDEFREHPRDIYRRSRGILEGAPDNLVALYFTREFSSPDEKGSNSVRLIETANRLLDIEAVKRLYESSDSQFKPKLLLILNDEYGKFNNSQGIKWLYEKANEQLHFNYDKELYLMREILGIPQVHHLSSEPERFNYDKELYLMREILGIALLCEDPENSCLDRFKKINRQLEEAFYG